MRILCNVNIVRTALKFRQVFGDKSCVAGRYICFTEPCTQRRTFSTSLRHLCNSDVDDKSLKKLMDKLGEKFTDARELLQDARDSQGTVYFSDDMMEAQEAVNDTIKEYKELLEKLSESQKNDVVKTIGLRMEELKAQKDAIEEELKE